MWRVPLFSVSCPLRFPYCIPPMLIINLSLTALFGLRSITNMVYTAFSPFHIFFFFKNLVVLVLTNLSTSVAIARFHTAFVAGSCMRCRYSNCFPVVGHVIAFTLFSNTSIPCINALISTSPVLLSMIALRRKGGIFSFVRGSSYWDVSSFICCLCTCWIILRVGYLCVA